MLQNKIKNSDLSDEDKANLNNILENGDQEFVEEYLKDVKMHGNKNKNLPTEKICEVFCLIGNVKRIAESFNCCENTILNHLKKSGWKAVQNKQEVSSNCPYFFALQRLGGGGWYWYPDSGLALELSKKIKNEFNYLIIFFNRFINF